MRTRNHPVEPEELMAYLDGELPHARAAETAAHLERCPECQTLAAELREVSRKLMAWQVETPEGAGSDDIFAALKDEERDRPPATKAGLHNWWNVILSHRILWAGGMAGAMALATIFLISNVQRAKSNRSVMEGYVNRPASSPDAGKTTYSYNSAPPSTAPAPPFSIKQREAKRSGAIKNNEYSVSRNAESAADQEAGATVPLNVASSSNPPPAPIGGPLLDKNGALNDLKKESSARQTVEVTASASTVEVRPDANTKVITNGRLDKDGAPGLRARAEQSPAEHEAFNKQRSPMIVHETQLSLVSRDFDQGRATIEEILKRHGGYVGSLNVSASPGSGRSLNATLRVPAVQLQDTLTELKKLGRVTAESQSGEEVTQQYVDLEARLANARNSEQRLKELQRDRTGKLKDVMEVELQIGRVREEIETMEAERKNLGNRVDYATLTVTLAEEYKAELQVVPVSTWTRMGNAAIEGYRTMVEDIVGVVLYVLSALPSLLLWTVILLFPARWTWKRIKLQRAAV